MFSDFQHEYENNIETFVWNLMSQKIKYSSALYEFNGNYSYEQIKHKILQRETLLL